jgi:Ni,Fe-hydrogenase I large subunit
MSNTAIADHALLADRHSTALVDRAGSVDWLTFPRFESPRSLVGSLGQMLATGASRQQGTGQAPAATWTGRSY